ncbi:MAG TPA: corrinoid protein [Anaerolineae bacterium]|jgi:5-methyltetrahydrofolate--homocysteine methyltransferase|nr:corrinoid protein [Anaerolineae bacterium]
MSEKYQDLYNGVLEGNIDATVAGVNAALAANNDPAEILSDGMISAMREVGRLFEEGEYFVPEMLIAARAMQAGLAILKPHLVDSGVEPVGKVAVGTVKGDLHDIGKNLVAMMLEGAGFAITDLGTDVGPDAFVTAIQEDGVDVVALSALLTTTMPSMQATISAIEAAGLRDNVKIIVGGAPVTEEYAKQIGADGFASDASGAVATTEALLGV